MKTPECPPVRTQTVGRTSSRPRHSTGAWWTPTVTIGTPVNKFSVSNLLPNARHPRRGDGTPGPRALDSGAADNHDGAPSEQLPEAAAEQQNTAALGKHAEAQAAGNEELSTAAQSPEQRWNLKARTDKAQSLAAQASKAAGAATKKPILQPSHEEQPKGSQMQGTALVPSAGPSSKPAKKRSKLAIKQEPAPTANAEPAASDRPRRLTAQLAMRRLKGDKDLAPPDLFADKQVKLEQLVKVAAPSMKVQHGKVNEHASIKQQQQQQQHARGKRRLVSKPDGDAIVPQQGQQQGSKTHEDEDVLAAATTLTVLSQDQQAISPCGPQANAGKGKPADSAAGGCSARPADTRARRTKASNATSSQAAGKGTSKAASKGYTTAAASSKPARRRRQSVLASSSSDDDVEHAKLAVAAEGYGEEQARAGEQHVHSNAALEAMQVERAGRKRKMAEPAAADSGGTSGAAAAQAGRTSAAAAREPSLQQLSKRRKQATADTTAPTMQAAAAQEQEKVADMAVDQPRTEGRAPAAQADQEQAQQADSDQASPCSDVDMVPATQLDSPVDQLARHLTGHTADGDGPQQHTPVADKANGRLALQMGTLLEIVHAASPNGTAMPPAGAASASLPAVRQPIQASLQQEQQQRSSGCNGAHDVRIDQAAPAPARLPAVPAIDLTVDPAEDVQAGNQGCCGHIVPDAVPGAVPGGERADAEKGNDGAGAGGGGGGVGGGAGGAEDGMPPLDYQGRTQADDDDVQQASSEAPAQHQLHQDAAPEEPCIHPASPPFMRSHDMGISTGVAACKQRTAMPCMRHDAPGLLANEQAEDAWVEAGDVGEVSAELDELVHGHEVGGGQRVLEQLQQTLQEESNLRLQTLQLLQQGLSQIAPQQQQQQQQLRQEHQEGRRLLPHQQPHPHKAHPLPSLLPSPLPGSSHAARRATVTPQQSRTVRLNAVSQAQAPVLFTQAHQQQAAVAAARRASAAPDQFSIDFHDDDDDDDNAIANMEHQGLYAGASQQLCADAHQMLPSVLSPLQQQHQPGRLQHSAALASQMTGHGKSVQPLHPVQQQILCGEQDMVDNDLPFGIEDGGEMQPGRAHAHDVFAMQHTGHGRHTAPPSQGASWQHAVQQQRVHDDFGSLGASSLGNSTALLPKPAFHVRSSALVLPPPTAVMPTAAAAAAAAAAGSLQKGSRPQAPAMLPSSALHLQQTQAAAEGAPVRQPAQPSRVPVLKPGLRAQQQAQVGAKPSSSVHTSSSGQQGSQGGIRNTAVQALVERAAKGLAAQATKGRTVAHHIEGWSSEQLRALHAAYKQVDPKHPRFWQEVAMSVPGRTAAECFTCMFNQHKTPEAKARVPRPMRLAAAQHAVKHEDGDGDEQQHLDGAGMDDDDDQQAGQAPLLPPGRKPTMAATLRWAREQHTRATIERLTGSNGASSSGAAAAPPLPGSTGNTTGLLPELVQALQQKEQADKYITSFLRQSGGWNKWQRTCKSGIQRRAETDIAALAAATGPPSAASTVTDAIHAALQEVQDLEADIEDEDLMQEGDYYFDME